MIRGYDKKAYALLKECSNNKDMTAWNSYREETHHIPINLRFVDLKDFYLIDANLQNIDFRGASLENSKCHGADVKNTNISRTFYLKISIFIIVLSFLGAMFLIYNLEFSAEVIDDFLKSHFSENSIMIAVVGFLTSIFILLIIIFPYNSSLHKNNPMLGNFIILVYFILTLSLSIYFLYIFLKYGSSMGSVLAIGMGIGGASIIILSMIVISLNTVTQKSLAYAKNPKQAIGFEVKYLKGITTPLSTHSDKEIAIVRELIKKEEDEKEKQELQQKLEELQKEKENALKKEAHAKTQQIKIQNALTHILQPYEYIERNISKLRKHNYFFYGLIVILISVFVYAILNQYLDTRSEKLVSVLNKDSVSFGAIFGIILFYATPILFGMSIIVYAITQINKNLQRIESMQEQRRSIEVLQSTLLAQTEIADVSDNEIKSLTQALQKGALERMFGQDKAKKNTAKETSSYREKIMINNLSKVLTQAFKSPK